VCPQASFVQRKVGISESASLLPAGAAKSKRRQTGALRSACIRFRSPGTDSCARTAGQGAPRALVIGRAGHRGVLAHPRRVRIIGQQAQRQQRLQCRPESCGMHALPRRHELPRPDRGRRGPGPRGFSIQRTPVSQTVTTNGVALSERRGFPARLVCAHRRDSAGQAIPSAVERKPSRCMLANLNDRFGDASIVEPPPSARSLSHEPKRLRAAARTFTMRDKRASLGKDAHFWFHAHPALSTTSDAVSETAASGRMGFPRCSRPSPIGGPRN
jgi:hypothetical protein